MTKFEHKISLIKELSCFVDTIPDLLTDYSKTKFHEKSRLYSRAELSNILNNIYHAKPIRKEHLIFWNMIYPHLLKIKMPNKAVIDYYAITQIVEIVENLNTLK